MEQWKITTIVVAALAFCLEMRPLDSFLTAYLTGPNVNATLNEVSNVLTPLKYYTSVISTFFLFLLSDYLRYKPIVVNCGLMGILTYLCLIDSPSMFRVKLSEIFSSMVVSSTMVYFGYLFAQIKDKEHYQVATGCVKSASLSGVFVSGILGQIVVNLNNSNYTSLPYYSLAGMIVATTLALLLPAVKRSKYFHAENIAAAAAAAVEATEKTDFSKKSIYNVDIPKYSTCDVTAVNKEKVYERKTKIDSFKCVYTDFKESYSNPTILRWSLWHAVGMAGYIQIYLYINILYTYVMDESDNKNELLNGITDSLSTVSAAFFSYEIGKTNVDWTRYGDVFLSLAGLVLGLLVCSCYWVKNIIVVYVIYIAFVTVVQSVFVIVISQIAKQTKNDCYILVLGFNACMSNTMTSITSVILVNAGISVPGKFLTYGGFFMALGVLYGCSVVYKRLATVKHFIRLP